MAEEFTLQKLKTELDTDPIGRGYSGMGDAAVSESLSMNKDRSFVCDVDCGTMLRWCARHDGILILERGAGHAAKPVRSACKTALELLRNPKVETLDLSDPEVQALFDGLVAAGLFTSAEKEDLEDLATKLVCRAFELWRVSVVTPSQVADARRLT